MAKQNDSQDSKGRSWDQITAGTTSAATMGAGSTGEVGAKAEGKGSAQRQDNGAMQQGGQGSAGRTDDLLAGGSNEEQSDKGFQANRQSESRSEEGARDNAAAPQEKGSARR